MTQIVFKSLSEWKGVGSVSCWYPGSKHRHFFHDMADVAQFLHRCHVWMWTHVLGMALPMESSLEDDVCAGFGCRMVTQHHMIQARTVLYLSLYVYMIHILYSHN